MNLLFYNGNQERYELEIQKTNIRPTHPLSRKSRILVLTSFKHTRKELLIMKTIGIVKENLLFILGLGALALVRPIMKMTGIMDLIGQQFGSMLMTILISLAWLVIVLIKKPAFPMVILIFAGMSYALYAVILSGLVSPLLDGKLQGPLTNPFALVSVFAINAIWGFIVGFIAKTLRR
ncbi:hypothetical protein [Paenibacillus sp. cl141a]|uniref:hypothetical protein n=1 Tax=Paenibacillus sp. cl141a TaxID=1761877 RepID=UPI0020C837B3|nr:hypothetical protein [Paenibacillus sp. cl141a]